MKSQSEMAPLAEPQSGSPGWQLAGDQSDQMAAPSPTTKAPAYRDPPKRVRCLT